MESKTSDDQSDEQNNKDIHLTTLNEVKKLKKNPGTQATSATYVRYPAACDIKNAATSTSTLDVTFVPIESISRSRQELRLSRKGSLECELKFDRASTTLVWQNLTVKTREDKRTEFFQRLRSYKHFQPKRKVLLHNLNGAITGGLWAVMGASGSGKSTLLNALACRLGVNTIVEGEMRLNGAPYDNAELKRIAGYVMQDDLLHGHLTIEETLMYTAELRLPRIWTNEQRKTRVEDIIAELGLNDVRLQIIGSHMKQGISGSERKRLCVGMQLLSRPQLLFLDEPTTGLDSVVAFDLLQTLYALAHGKFQQQPITVVCSIHQPQAKIFNLFDAIILLRSGHIVYQGSRKQVMKTFQVAGFPCPLYTNPADHLLDVVTPIKNDLIAVDQETFSSEKQLIIDAAILAAHPPIDIDLNMGCDKRDVQMNNLPLNPRWNKQVRILLRRNFQEQRRKFRVILVSLIQSVILAVFIGTIFFQIGNSQKSIFRRESMLFSCVVNQGLFGALMIINSFPAERTLTLRERASGTYCASAYFTAKIMTDTLVQLPVPITFSCIVYFLVGFQGTAVKFILFMLIIILCSITSTSIALMVSALCKTTMMSITVLPMVLEVSRLFGGFLLAPSRIPKYFSWLDALSYFKYIYVALSLNELEGLQLTCDNTTQSCIRDGQTLIKDRGFDYINIPACIGVLLMFIVFSRVIAYLGVRFLKH